MRVVPLIAAHHRLGPRLGLLLLGSIVHVLGLLRHVLARVLLLSVHLVLVHVLRAGRHRVLLHHNGSPVLIVVLRHGLMYRRSHVSWLGNGLLHVVRASVRLLHRLHGRLLPWVISRRSRF